MKEFSGQKLITS